MGARDPRGGDPGLSVTRHCTRVPTLKGVAVTALPVFVFVAVFLGSLALVIAADHLIIGWRGHRREIASLKKEISALNERIAVLNASVRYPRGDSGVLTGISLLISIPIAAVVLWPILFPPRPSPPPLPPPPPIAGQPISPENSDKPQQNISPEKSDKPRQNIVGEALGQLRMIMEQWKLTRASAFEPPNKPHQSPKPVLVHRPYYSCCCRRYYAYYYRDYYW